MLRRRKAEREEIKRLTGAVADLNAELTRVGGESARTQALHDEFRTSAFAAWSAEVERLTVEFGGRFASAFEGIEELQGLSTDLEGRVGAMLVDLERTGADVAGLVERVSGMATAGQMASAFEGIEELQGVSTGLRGRIDAVLADLERVSVDVSALAERTERHDVELGEATTARADQEESVRVLATGLGAIQRSLAKAPSPTTKAPTPTTGGPTEAAAAEVPLDQIAAETVYAALEERLRGSPEAIREQQSAYVDLIRKLPGSKPVADLGCGRGEFLGLLAEAGIAGLGVDLSTNFVDECREQGLDAREQDLLEFLGEQKARSLRAVVSFQVLEHLPFPVLLRTFAEAFRVLVPGGLFLHETPNGANIAVGGSTFWLDHTHMRPLHPELLRHFAEFYGYGDVRVDLVSRPDVPWRLDHEAGGEPLSDAVLGLQEYVLSGQDALLVAYRPREPRKARSPKASTTRPKRSS